jgi:threonine/homoserine/homoserine lactone efflux protein
MTIEACFIFFVTLLLLWIKPGPGQAMIVARALKDGFWPAFSLALGAMVGGVFYFIAAVIGVSAIQDNIEIIGVVLKLIGAIFLFYLGYCGLKDIKSGQWESQKKHQSNRGMITNFMAGLVVELSNPITIFYFLGILPTLMSIDDITMMDIVVGSIIILYGGMVFYCIVIAFCVQVKETLRDTNVVKNINLITSISFILIGLFFFYSAFFMSGIQYSII